MQVHARLQQVALQKYPPKKMRLVDTSRVPTKRPLKFIEVLAEEDRNGDCTTLKFNLQQTWMLQSPSTYRDAYGFRRALMGESYKGPCSELCVENYPSLVFVNYVSDHHSSSGKDVIKYKPFMDAEDVLKFLLSEFARRGQYDEIFEDDADAVSKEETVYTLHHTVHLRASASGGAFLGTRRQASLSLSLSPPPFSPTLSLANYLPAPRQKFYTHAPMPKRRHWRTLARRSIHTYTRT